MGYDTSKFEKDLKNLNIELSEKQIQQFMTHVKLLDLVKLQLFLPLKY